MKKVFLAISTVLVLFAFATPASAQRRCGPQFINGTIHIFPPCGRQYGWQHGQQGRHWGPSRPQQRQPIMFGERGGGRHVVVRREHHERRVHVEGGYSQPSSRGYAQPRRRANSCAPVRQATCCDQRQVAGFDGGERVSRRTTSNQDVVTAGFYVIKQ